SALSWLCLVCETNSEREDGALSRRRLDRQLARVRLDNPSRDRQAKSRAAARGVRHLDERLEDSGQRLGWNTCSGIRDRNRDLFAALRCRDRDRAASWGGAGGVCDQIGDHSFDLAPVDGYGREVRGGVGGQAGATEFP